MIISHKYKFIFLKTNKTAGTSIEIVLCKFLESDTLLLLKRRGLELYTINGQIAVDKVCRFENISEELEVIRTRVGLPEKLDLPRAKSRFRKDKRSYRDILDVKEKAKIAELFSQEISLFGYEY